MSYPKVTIVGAGNVGASAAWLLLQKDLANVALVDVVDGLAEGKALDMMHMRSIERFGPRIIGSNSYDITAGSDIVVITAGIARKPGMTREDLLATNSKILTSCIDAAVDASPHAIFIIVTNPLDQMAYLAYKRALEKGIPHERVIGMGGVLDSARFAYEIARATEGDIRHIEALVIGAHGQGMLPLTRYSSVNESPVTDLLSEEEIAQIEERTVNGGAEVVSLLKTGSAFYAPGASIVAMIQAMLNDTGQVMSASTLLTGEYGYNDIYMCVPVHLGREGVGAVEELQLSDEEQARLDAAAQAIAQGVDELGLR